MKSEDINKGDKVVCKLIDWTYYSTDKPYNKREERISKTGTVIAKSKYGVLVKWDKGIISQEWIQYKNFDRSIGDAAYGFKTNTYTRYEKLKMPEEQEIKFEFED